MSHHSSVACHARMLKKNWFPKHPKTIRNIFIIKIFLNQQEEKKKTKQRDIKMQNLSLDDNHTNHDDNSFSTITSSLQLNSQQSVDDEEYNYMQIEPKRSMSFDHYGQQFLSPYKFEQDVLVKMANHCFKKQLICIYTGSSHSTDELTEINQYNIEHVFPRRCFINASVKLKNIINHDWHNIHPARKYANEARSSYPFAMKICKLHEKVKGQFQDRTKSTSMFLGANINETKPLRYRSREASHLHKSDHAATGNRVHVQLHDECFDETNQQIHPKCRPDNIQSLISRNPTTIKVHVIHDEQKNINKNDNSNSNYIDDTKTTCETQNDTSTIILHPQCLSNNYMFALNKCFIQPKIDKMGTISRCILYMIWVYKNKLNSPLLLDQFVDAFHVQSEQGQVDRSYSHGLRLFIECDTEYPPTPEDHCRNKYINEFVQGNCNPFIGWWSEQLKEYYPCPPGFSYFIMINSSQFTNKQIDLFHHYQQIILMTSYSLENQNQQSLSSNNNFPSPKRSRPTDNDDVWTSSRNVSIDDHDVDFDDDADQHRRRYQKQRSSSYSPKRARLDDVWTTTYGHSSVQSII